MATIGVRGAPRRIRINPQTGQTEEATGKVRDFEDEWAPTGVSEAEAKKLLGFDATSEETPGRRLTMRQMEAGDTFARPTASAPVPSSPDEAMWRTLAPKRDLPTTYARQSDVPAGSGHYVSYNGGKFMPADMGSMGQLAAGGDFEAGQALQRRTMEDATRAANAVRPNWGFTYTGDNLLDAQLGKMHHDSTQAMRDRIMGGAVGMNKDLMENAQKAFDADTRRAQTGLQEYEQKVRMPESEKRKADHDIKLQEMRDAVEREKIAAADKGVTSAAFAQALVRKLESGASEEELKAFARLGGDLEGLSRKAKKGDIGVKTGAGDIPVPVDHKTATAATAFLKKLGFSAPGKGEEAGKFNIDTLAFELAKNPALVNVPSVAAALRRGVGNLTPEQLRAEVEKAMIRRKQSGKVGDFEISSKFIEPNPGGMLTIPKGSYTISRGGLPVVKHSFPRIPFGATGAGLARPIGPIASADQLREEEEAGALAAALQVLLGQARTP
jgi:hypothetical protein